jgi:hypothetical protein
LKKFYLFICFVFLLFNARSQFTYINVSGGYEGLSLYSNAGSTLTGVKSFIASVSAISRFKRHFGVGFEFSLPISQNFDFSFKNSETSSGVFFEKKVTDILINDEFNRYFAYQYNYNVSYQSIISLFGRIYFDSYLNFYTDVNVSYLKVSEAFTFVRPYYSSYGSGNNFIPEIPAENINYNEEYNFISPGLRFGLSPHITDHLYLDFKIGVNFILFDKVSFEYRVPYDYSNYDNLHQYVIFESQASGLKTIFSTSLGIGFYF